MITERQAFIEYFRLKNDIASTFKVAEERKSYCKKCSRMIQSIKSAKEIIG